MSNEHDNNDSDPKLSELYRELASERTPQALDRAVLDEAARAARTRGKMPGKWFRPLAYAATVGLTLAVVLQINEPLMPVQRGLEEPEAAFDLDAAKEKDDAAPDSEFKAAPAGSIEAPVGRTQAPIAGSNVSVEQSKPTIADAPVPDGAVAVDPGADELRLDDAAKKELHEYVDKLQKIRANSHIEADAALAPQDDDARKEIREYEDRLRQFRSDHAVAPDTAVQEEQFIDTGAPGRGTERLGIVSSPDPRSCDDEQRADADSWWECIEELRADGKAREALDELAVFVEAHPDYLPAN